jgi:quercetin dioxygenase-like cupin family protein
MNQTKVGIRVWEGPDLPAEGELREHFAAEGLRPYSWSNAPGDVYPPHSHSYHKVIYIVEGSITFGLPEQRKKATLYPGDRLDLPAGVLHDAVVGPQGVRCLEAHKVE